MGAKRAARLAQRVEVMKQRAGLKRPVRGGAGQRAR
jgi:hypothetical protein